MIDPIFVSKYENKILEIIENVDEFTQSDLQGAIGAVVINMVREVEDRMKQNHSVDTAQ